MRIKWLPVLLGLVIVLAISPLAGAQFDDEPQADHWVYESFNLVYQANLLKGYPDGTFKGERPATRYEMVEFMARLLTYFEEQLAAAEEDDLTEERVNEMIAAFFADHPSGLSQEEVRSMIDSALAENDWTSPEEVQAMIDQALANLPPILTEDDVRRLAEEVLAEKTILSEDDVKGLIEEALEGRSLTDEEIEAEIDDIYEAIQDLEEQFYADLEALDVRVTTLESEVEKIKEDNRRQDEALAKLRADLDQALAKLQAAQEEEARIRAAADNKAAEEIEAAKKEAKRAKTLGALGLFLAILGFLV